MSAGHDRGRRSTAGALLAVGMVVTVTGAVMYVLPGPGLPFLCTGAVLLLGAGALRLRSRGWR